MRQIEIEADIFSNIPKGQIILKGLFGVLKFSQKTNERFRRSSKNEFVRSFFGRIRGYQKSFRNYLTFSKVSNFLVFVHLKCIDFMFQLELSLAFFSETSHCRTSKFQPSTIFKILHFK